MTKNKIEFLSTSDIEKKTTSLLKKYDVWKIPVDLELLAHRMGLRVDYSDLGEDVSGVIVIAEKGGDIGINSEHSNIRQRFTLAHEIGHYVLHRNSKDLFIDKSYAKMFRNQNSSNGTDRVEIQANIFASTLLMPEIKIRKYIKEQELDLANGTELDDVAEQFLVSLQTLIYRLTSIHNNK